MLAAIEKIRPNLAALASGHSASRANETASDKSPTTASKKADAVPASTADSVACWKCGNALIDEEQFCGKCGAPRIGESDSSTLQSKLASALHMHQASQELPITALPERVLDFTDPKYRRDCRGKPNRECRRVCPGVFSSAAARAFAGRDGSTGRK